MPADTPAHITPRSRQRVSPVFLLIFAVVLAIVGAGVYYFVVRSQTPVSDIHSVPAVNTYVSKVWNFSFDYPVTFSQPTVVESDDGTCEQVWFHDSQLQYIAVQLAADGYYCTFSNGNSEVSMFGVGNAQPATDINVFDVQSANGLTMHMRTQSLTAGGARVVGYNIDMLPENLPSGLAPDSPDAAKYQHLQVVGFYGLAVNTDAALQLETVIKMMITSSHLEFTKL